MIDHKTIGSGDEPEHACVIVDPLPGHHRSHYASMRDLRDLLAFCEIQRITQ